MSLFQTAIKIHPKEEEIVNWGSDSTFLLPIPESYQQLSREERIDRIQKEFPDNKIYPEPVVIAPLPRVEGIDLSKVLIVVADSSPREREQATDLAKSLGLALETIVNAADLSQDERETKALILLGGSHRNPITRAKARRSLAGVMDACWPPNGEWGITSYPGTRDEPSIIVVESPAERFSEVIAWLRSQIRAVGSRNTLPLVWHYSFAAEESPLGQWRQHLNRSDYRLRLFQDWVDGGQKEPWREVMAKALREAFSPGRNSNSEGLNLANEAARFYMFTGSMEALIFFRDSLLGIDDFLQTPVGNINYPSDYDFQAGSLINNWSVLEHHPIFEEAARLQITTMLLASARMTAGYYAKLWLHRRNGQPHNHQTFPARTNLLAARYFANFPALRTETDKWQEDAEILFRRADLNRSKFTENAHGYENYVPEHLVAWHAITGKPIPGNFRASLARLNLRCWTATDNFIFPVDYGDSHVTLHPFSYFNVYPWLNGDEAGYSEVIAREKLLRKRSTFKLLAGSKSFPGLNLNLEGNFQLNSCQWEVAPLEAGLGELEPLIGSQDEQFDKLAWRSGWQEQSLYLGIEGYGNKKISHSHNELNGIMRFNAGGRIWLVSNGYGRPVGINDVSVGFRNRQIGPADHNMIVIQEPNDPKPVVPPINALLRKTVNEPFPVSVTELQNYGGFHWVRTIVILGEVGFICYDRLIRIEPAATLPSIHGEWNFLGQANATSEGGLVEQNGVALKVIQPFANQAAEWSELDNWSWGRTLSDKNYPHATMPLQKCVFSLQENAAKSIFSATSVLVLENALSDFTCDEDRFRLNFPNAILPAGEIDLSHCKVTSTSQWIDFQIA